MPNLTVITESLAANGYVLNPAADYRDVEYSRNLSDGTLETVIIDFPGNTVIKQRYSAKGTQIDYAEVDVLKPGNMSLALRLAA